MTMMLVSLDQSSTTESYLSPSNTTELPLTISELLMNSYNTTSRMNLSRNELNLLHRGQYKNRNETRPT